MLCSAVGESRAVLTPNAEAAQAAIADRSALSRDTLQLSDAVSRSAGAATARLSNGVVLSVGGMRRATTTSDCGVSAALLMPSVMHEHTFDNELERHTEYGPLRWQYPLPASMADDDFRVADVTKRCEHVLCALPDLRVVMFGGRRDPMRAATSLNDLWIADFGLWMPPADWMALQRENGASSCTEVAQTPPWWFVKVEERRQCGASVHKPSDPVPRKPDSLVSPNRQRRVTLSVGGSAPCARFGHTATLIADSLILITGGTDEKGRVLSDMHCLVVYPTTSRLPEGGAATAADDGPAETTRGRSLGEWIKLPGSLAQLPAPCTHHQVLCVPFKGDTPSDSVTLLLIRDGRELFLLTLAVSSGRGTRSVTAAAPWMKLPSGGVHRSVPYRRQFAAAFVSADEVLVHGGCRCAPDDGKKRAATPLLVGRPGDIVDAAFVYHLKTYAWSFRRSVTEGIGYLSGHALIRLSAPGRDVGQQLHYLCVGGGVDSAAKHCGDVSSSSTTEGRSPPLIQTISSDAFESVVFPPSEDEAAIAVFAPRLCNGVVRRVGVEVGDASSLVDALHMDRSSSPPMLTLSSACQVGHPTNRGDLSSPCEPQWIDPSSRVRERLLVAEANDATSVVRRHLTAVLLQALRAESTVDTIKRYFSLWRSFAAVRSVAEGGGVLRSVAARRAAEELALCTSCCRVPIEVLLQPCGHFTLCSSCASVAEECPDCGKPLLSTTLAFRGQQYPLLHKFLSEERKAALSEEKRIAMWHQLRQSPSVMTNNSISIDAMPLPPAIEHAADGLVRYSSPIAKHAPLTTGKRRLCTRPTSAISDTTVIATPLLTSFDYDGMLASSDAVSDLKKPMVQVRSRRSLRVSGPMIL